MTCENRPVPGLSESELRKAIISRNQELIEYVYNHLKGVGDIDLSRQPYFGFTVSKETYALFYAKGARPVRLPASTLFKSACLLGDEEMLASSEL